MDLLITFLASFLIWFMFAGLLVLWISDGKIRKEQIIHALLASLITWIIAESIKLLFPTLRPFLLNGSSVKTLTIPNDGAFPSSHAAAAFALATTVWFHDKKVGWFYLVAACLVGTARIMANVHFFIDIIGGAFLGIIASFVIEKARLFKILEKKF